MDTPKKEQFDPNVLEEGKLPENQDNEDMYDLTKYAQPGSGFVTVKIPTSMMSEVEKLVQSPPPPPKKIIQRNSDKKKKRIRIKGTWTKEEDETLLKLVSKYGAKKWPNIALKMRGRNGKQCRERFLNHLDASINHGEWAKDEDDIIIRMHAEHGNQWAKMARQLKGRPANKIKNRWNSTLSKIVNKQPMSRTKSNSSGSTKRKALSPRRKKRNNKNNPRRIPPPILVVEQQEIKFDEPSPASQAVNAMQNQFTPNNPRRSTRLRRTANPFASQNFMEGEEMNSKPPPQITPPRGIYHHHQGGEQYRLDSDESGSGQFKSFLYPLPEQFPEEFLQRIGKKRGRPLLGLEDDLNLRRQHSYDPPLKKRKTTHYNNNNNINSPYFNKIMTPPRSSNNLRIISPSESHQDTSGPLSLSSPPFFRNNTDLSLFEGEELTSLFPSPVNLEEKKNEAYKRLIEQNRKTIHERSKQSTTYVTMKEREEIAKLDAKLGIGVSELEKDDDFSGMYERHPEVGDLMLNPDDSALFASDYGINLKTPSQLTLGIWSPKSDQKNEQIELHNNNNNNNNNGNQPILRINVHPLFK